MARGCMWLVVLGICFCVVCSVAVVSVSKLPPKQEQSTPTKKATSKPSEELTDADVFQSWVIVKKADDRKWVAPVYERLQEIRSVNHCRIGFTVINSPGEGVTLAEHGGEVVWIEGITDEVIDGRNYTLDGLFKPIGTKRYKAVNGANKTVAGYRFCGGVPPSDYVPPNLRPKPE